jgi:alanine or glycine:cation symporter, AGCS family
MLQARRGNGICSFHPVKEQVKCLSMADLISAWLDSANALLWGVPMLVLLIGTHLYLTFRLGLIQRLVLHGIRLSISLKKLGSGDISQFGALVIAMASTVGTGNIVGVATAVGMGGPGAIFWMWLTGVLGMATKFTEALLAVKYRQVNERGEMTGGPMEVIRNGLGWTWLAGIFAACALLASFGIGNMNQANSIAHQVQNFIPAIPVWLTGAALSIVVGAVILGGVKAIARTCMVLVPIMLILYVGGCLILLAMRLDALIPAVGLILREAFSTEAIGGGILGTVIAQAMRYGIARGLFSNESGMGSGGFFAAAARTRNPAQQALVSMTGTFWDTVVICLLTGLVLITSGAYLMTDPDGQVLRGAALTNAAFGQVPILGPTVLTIALLTFVFSTLIGWSYIGEKSAEYLFGVRMVLPFRVVWVLMAFVGATSELTLVWSFSDFANALMALPNIVSLLLLSGVAARETRKCLEDPGTLRT